MDYYLNQYNSETTSKLGLPRKNIMITLHLKGGIIKASLLHSLSKY